MICVDDGSSAQSLQVLKQLHNQDYPVQYGSFSRDFGHQIALKVGLDCGYGKCEIFMDVDMQDPPEAYS